MKGYQSMVDRLLDTCIEHVGEWCCAYCATESGQSAGVFREIKAKGYLFEKATSSRWGKSMYCPICDMQRTHYKLLSTVPDTSLQKVRDTSLNHPNVRNRILKLLGSTCAYSGKSTNEPSIDHKTPVIRLKKDYDIRSMSDEEIKESFQLLSYTSNLIKNSACVQCHKTGKRQPLYGINFFYKGDEDYEGTCEGCGYHDCERWKSELQSRLNGNSRSGLKKLFGGLFKF